MIGNMVLRLEASRLVLRPFQESDLDAFLAYRNDPEVARYQSWDVPYSRTSGIQFIEYMQMASPGQRGEWYQLVLELKSSHTVIGDVAFCPTLYDERQTIMGYSLSRLFWRQGYAFEAVSTLLVYLFQQLNMHRIVAECDVENIASWKLLEKLGFRREAHLIENVYFKGKYGSEYHYAMLRREWEQNS